MVNNRGQGDNFFLEKNDETNRVNHSKLVKISNLIEENTKVLYFSNYGATLTNLLIKKKCAVTGVSFDESSIKITEKALEQTIVIESGKSFLQDLFSGKTFDVAVFDSILEYLDDLGRILTEIRELLNPKGYVIASIPNVAHGSIRLALLQGNFDSRQQDLLERTPVRFFTRETIEQLFESSGYIIEIADRVRLPVSFDSPVQTPLDRDFLENELLPRLENDLDLDTLHFIARAFPASIENRYSSLQKKYLDKSNQLKASRAELKKTRVSWENSRMELQKKEVVLTNYRSRLHQTEESLETSRSELDRVRKSLETTRSELEKTREFLEGSRSDLEQTREKLKGTETELQESRSRLEYYRIQIDAMKTSKFWKLREKWFKAKKILGFSLSETEILSKRSEPDSRDNNFKLFVDLAILIPELGIYAEGWFYDPKSEIKEIAFITENETANFKSILQKKDRLDLVKYLENIGIEAPPKDLGFFVLCSLKSTKNIDSLQLEVRQKSGEIEQTTINLFAIPNDPCTIIQNILTYNPCPNYRMRQIFDNHLGITARNLWKQRESCKIQKEVREYGSQVDNPRVSIVVPLYGRIDFIKYQLALFADDPDLQANELIYILDDPRLYEDFLYFCDAQSSIFEIPFKTVYTGLNQGYAGAINFGVSIARGQQLLLLHSDIMPIQSGWLSSLVEVYDNLSAMNVGAIAPKLLYGNGSIQHVGIEFARCRVWDNFWITEHPRKGQPNVSECKSPPRKFVAVTGACMMVDRELYERVGGLDEEYIVAGYEDSDFCLKLHAIGYDNYYVPSVELCHLERQSLSLYPDRDGRNLWDERRALYNCWLFNQKWEEYITQKI